MWKHFFTALLRFTLTFLFNFILIFHSYMYNPKQKKKVINEYTFFIVGITNEVSLREGILCFLIPSVLVFFFLVGSLKQLFFICIPWSESTDIFYYVFSFSLFALKLHGRFSRAKNTVNEK